MRYFVVVLFILISFPILGVFLMHGEARASSEEGQKIFQQKCISCHTVGGGRVVGPDLKGVTARRDEAWLVRWIKEPDKMLSEGDPLAAQLLREFNNVPMPNMGLSSADAVAVISYLEEASGGTSAPKTSGSMPERGEPHLALPVGQGGIPPPFNVATQDEIELGQNLFQGMVRFVNNGPSCTSCHHVKNDAVIGGGILAKDLTTVFSRMGGEGVRAILGGPPFPVMQAAYKGMSFTDDEIRALVGFLEHSDKEHVFQQPRDYGWGLFIAGAGGIVVLMGFYSVIGRRRKKRSVNQDIYDRQIKSE